MRTTHFRLGNAQSLEKLGMLHRQLNDLLDLFDLLVQAAHHFICRVRHFLNHHQADQWVNCSDKPPCMSAWMCLGPGIAVPHTFVGQNLVELIVVVSECNTQGRRDLGHVNAAVNIGHVLAFWMNLEGSRHGACQVTLWANKPTKGKHTLTRTFFFPMTLTTSPTYEPMS